MAQAYKMQVTLSDGTLINAGTIEVPEEGEPGVGVESVEVAYQASSSNTTIPTGTWSNSITSVGASQGQYLWTRVISTLTDGSSSTIYMVSYSAVDGANGDKGTDGVSVSDVKLEEV